MMLPPLNALHVQHDPGLRFMRFQWREPAGHYLRAAQAPARSLRPMLAYGRDLIIAEQPTHGLVDFEGLPPISLADELWMTVNWVPQIAAQSLQQVAMVLRREHLHNQMTVETLLWAGRQLLRFDLQVFDDAAAALDWLVGGDAATAARLQAEWDSLPPLPAPTLPT